MSNPVVIIELNEAVALSTNERELRLPSNSLHLPAVAGKLLAQRTPFGHDTRTYYDYLSDKEEPVGNDYETMSEFLAGLRREKFLPQITTARKALQAQHSLIFQSFHDFFGELKKQRATVVLRYAPHVDAHLLIQELEFFHEVQFQRGEWKQGQLYYDREPVEMKEALDDGLHVWADEEQVVPFPTGIPSLTFAVREGYERGSWRDPISTSVVATRIPHKEVLLAQVRGNLVLVDQWRALTEPQYFQQCYREALLARADANLRAQSWLQQQEQLEIALQNKVRDTIEHSRQPRSAAFYSWSLAGLTPLQQSQFYALLQRTIQNLPPEEWAQLHFVNADSDNSVPRAVVGCTTASSSTHRGPPRVLSASACSRVVAGNSHRRFKVRRGERTAPVDLTEEKWDPSSLPAAPVAAPTPMELC